MKNTGTLGWAPTSRWSVVATAWLLGSCSLALNPEIEAMGETPFGGSCSDDAECTTGECRSGRCTQACTSSCPTGGTCGGDGFCTFSGPPPKPRLQVGLLYVGPVGDHGWTKAHDDGRQYFLEQLDDTSAMFAPSVAATDAAARIEEFVARGDNVVIGTSFDFLTAIQSAALRHPDVNFMLCSGFQTGPNLGSYFGRMYQVMYQAGRLAGQVTRTNKIGIVGPIVIPETVRHVNAFTQGVRSVNSEAEVVVEWAFAWFAPEAEAAAANALLDAGVDVVFGHTDTTIPIETANARNTTESPVFTIGYDNPDSCTFAEETCITSAYWNWGPIVTRILEQMQQGTWQPEEAVWDQMQADPATSTAYLAPISTRLVPSAVRLDVEGLVDDLSQPTDRALYLPFLGPVRDNAGTLRIAEGAMPTDRDLLNMCWHVAGVYDVDGNPAAVPSGCVGDR
ncbi:MAG: BMP family ABC transporter substrate-binding protein [Myxococcales bacterium]|nr:BMP family ABC transporter substrate-binding protein [Myxococcales bacterium]